MLFISIETREVQHEVAVINVWQNPNDKNYGDWITKIFLKTDNFGMNYMKHIDNIFLKIAYLNHIDLLYWYFLNLDNSNLQDILSTSHIAKKDNLLTPGVY